MTAFRFTDEAPRTYHDLGEVAPGDIRDLDGAPDYRWQAVDPLAPQSQPPVSPPVEQTPPAAPTVPESPPAQPPAQPAQPPQE